LKDFARNLSAWSLRKEMQQQCEELQRRVLNLQKFMVLENIKYLQMEENQDTLE
jgi:hypothetical protein